MTAHKRTGFIPIHALLMLVVVLYAYQANGGSSILFSDTCFAVLLVLMGTVIYLCTSKNTSSLLLLLLMYASAWIMISLNTSLSFHKIIGQPLMSLMPNLMFIFFVTFTQLPRKRLYYKWNIWLLHSSALTLVGLWSPVKLLGYLFCIHILLAILACIRMSVYYGPKQRQILNQERWLLNGAMTVSFVPFIVSVLLLRSWLPQDIRNYSIYMMIVLPAAVGYVLIKRNGIQTRYDYRFMLKLTAIAGGGAAAFVGLAYYEVGISLLQSLFLLLLASLIIYLYMMAQKAMAKRQLKEASRAKGDLEKERLEILQKITYDHYLSALSGMIKQLIDKTLPMDGTMIIWREQERSYVLEQSGIFKDFALKRLSGGQLHRQTEHVMIDGKLYFAFPLFYKETLNGWMVVGHKRAGGKFTTGEVETLSLLANTVCEILKTTEILHENQRRYVSLPSLRCEDYQNMHVTRNAEKIRKEVALYLHDDILQSILAVRRMCEVAGGEDPEIRELMLDTLDELNDSIRRKMFDIYPTTLQDLGLYQSLSILCRKLREEAVQQPHLNIRLEAEEEIGIEESLQYPVFRTLKELLQNAIKHASANEIVVSLEISEEGILLADVIDDGKGFDIEKDLDTAEVQHIGLLSVKQEINALGGEFIIRKNADSGMHLQFKLPLGRTGNEYASYTG